MDGKTKADKKMNVANTVNDAEDEVLDKVAGKNNKENNAGK